MLAFEQLVFRHDRSVLSIAARYVSTADDAKDIYQEVFIRVYRGLKNFRFQSEFATWLHRIAVNVCLSHRARARRSLQVQSLDAGDENDDGSDGRSGIASDGVLPDSSAMNADIAAHVEEALNSLSPKQRMAFTLRHYEGYKLKEIAEMMECVEGTVKRYLFTATRKMREQLQDML